VYFNTVIIYLYIPVLNKLKLITMKRITIIFLIASVIIAGCTQKRPSQKTILGLGTDYFMYPETLNGKIKEVRELNYWAVEKQGKTIKGQALTWKELDSIGSTKNFAAYFDTSGVLTRYELLGDDNLPRYCEIGTIVNGKIVKWESKIKDSLTYYAIPQYDNKGFIVGGSGYRPVNDSLLGKQVLAHDGKGNYTKIEFFNNRNERTSYRDFTLNSEGKVTGSKLFNMKDSLVNIQKNTYNRKGSLTKTEIFKNSKLVSLWKMTENSVDDHGNCLETICDINKGKFKIIIMRAYIYY
jgi:hypothetical protein